MTSASLMHEAGHPKPVLWDNPEGWGEGGDGVGAGETGWGTGWRDTCLPMADSC